MTGIKAVLAGFVTLVLNAGSAGGLSALMLEGPELHPSLATRSLDERQIRHIPWKLLRSNPQHSSDAEFVHAIARSGSQGTLDSTGISSALYALYAGESDLGMYGLEASNVADAQGLEIALREIWAKNASLDRARVHRSERVLVVVWTDGVPPETWEAVNAQIANQLRLSRRSSAKAGG